MRIARYLDVLTAAAGGPRRAELVSESEIKHEHDELDFDSQVFDGYAPSEGAPGPEQAPEWEDQDQPEADVAAALGLDLAELRSLRTPVPVRPAGMAPVSGREPEPVKSAPDPAPANQTGSRATPPLPRPTSVDDEAPTIDSPKPEPRKRPVTVEEDGPPEEQDLDMDAATLAVTQPLPPRAQPRPAPLAQVPIRPLPANTSQRLPWLVALLGVAVAVLVAYIVLT
ncbi:MAG: hypothetical protein H0V17_11165 [Deltaproteobacteria bacterium]|nr:hypothetical protein [Deltaproteobacteria bacterium]